MGYWFPRAWKQSNLPIGELGNVDKVLGDWKELNLVKMNRTRTPFVGWIEVNFKLSLLGTTQTLLNWQYHSERDKKSKSTLSSDSMRGRDFKEIL